MMTRLFLLIDTISAVRGGDKVIRLCTDIEIEYLQSMDVGFCFVGFVFISVGLYVFLLL